MNAKTDLAAKFPASPLENHHLEVSLEILSKPESDIFKNVDMNRRDSIRQVQEYAHTVKGRESRRTYVGRIDKYFSSSASKRSFPWMTHAKEDQTHLEFQWIRSWTLDAMSKDVDLWQLSLCGCTGFWHFRFLNPPSSGHLKPHSRHGHVPTQRHLRGLRVQDRRRVRLRQSGSREGPQEHPHQGVRRLQRVQASQGLRGLGGSPAARVLRSGDYIQVIYLLIFTSHMMTLDFGTSDDYVPHCPCLIDYCWTRELGQH